MALIAQENLDFSTLPLDASATSTTSGLCFDFNALQQFDQLDSYDKISSLYDTTDFDLTTFSVPSSSSAPIDTPAPLSLYTQSQLETISTNLTGNIEPLPREHHTWDFPYEGDALYNTQPAIMPSSTAPPSTFNSWMDPNSVTTFSASTPFHPATQSPVHSTSNSTQSNGGSLSAFSPLNGGSSLGTSMGDESVKLSLQGGATFMQPEMEPFVQQQLAGFIQPRTGYEQQHLYPQYSGLVTMPNFTPYTGSAMYDMFVFGNVPQVPLQQFGVPSAMDNMHGTSFTTFSSTLQPGVPNAVDPSLIAPNMYQFSPLSDAVSYSTPTTLDTYGDPNFASGIFVRAATPVAVGQDAFGASSTPLDMHSSRPVGKGTARLSTTAPRGSQAGRASRKWYNHDEANFVEGSSSSVGPIRTQRRATALPDGKKAKAKRTDPTKIKIRFLSDDDLDSHFMVISDHECKCLVPGCPSMLGRPGDARRHLASTHGFIRMRSQSTSRECPACLKTFIRPDALKRHMNDGWCSMDAGKAAKVLARNFRKSEHAKKPKGKGNAKTAKAKGKNPLKKGDDSDDEFRL